MLSFEEIEAKRIKSVKKTIEKIIKNRIEATKSIDARITDFLKNIIAPSTKSYKYDYERNESLNQSERNEKQNLKITNKNQNNASEGFHNNKEQKEENDKRLVAQNHLNEKVIADNAEKITKNEENMQHKISLPDNLFSQFNLENKSTEIEKTHEDVSSLLYDIKLHKVPAENITDKLNSTTNATNAVDLIHILDKKTNKNNNSELNSFLYSKSTETSLQKESHSENNSFAEHNDEYKILDNQNNDTFKKSFLSDFLNNEKVNTKNETLSKLKTINSELSINPGMVMNNEFFNNNPTSFIAQNNEKTLLFQDSANTKFLATNNEKNILFQDLTNAKSLFFPKNTLAIFLSPKFSDELKIIEDISSSTNKRIVLEISSIFQKISNDSSQCLNLSEKLLPYIKSNDFIKIFTNLIIKNCKKLIARNYDLYKPFSFVFKIVNDEKLMSFFVYSINKSNAVKKEITAIFLVFYGTCLLENKNNEVLKYIIAIIESEYLEERAFVLEAFYIVFRKRFRNQFQAEFEYITTMINEKIIPLIKDDPLATRLKKLLSPEK